VPNVPSPWPSTRLTVLEPPLSTARSGVPSPSRSPAARKLAFPPAATLIAAWKLPSPFPSSTLTLPAALLSATARSGLWSPLKSAMTTHVAEGSAA